MKTLEFKASPGFGKWKKYYPKSSISHPAKINQNLLEYLILNYTNEGENVVDPIAGSGSTGVMCALNGRNCISVELEEKFWRWMEIARENVENTPQLTPKGKIINIRGDSRKLSELLKEHEEEISSVLFSPPYKTANEGGGLNKHPPATFRGVLKNHSFKLSDNPNNIDNLPFGKADTIITSPPYAQSTSPFVRGTSLKDGDDLPTIRCLNIQDGYSESMENIGNVHYFDEGKPLSKKHAKANGKETYLQAMEKVYGGCHKILKKDGLMILVLKNLIRQKQLVPLTEHTVKLCESCGFTLKERLLFKLPQQSFWRVLGKKQWEAEGREYPKDLSYEHILIFKKT